MANEAYGLLSTAKRVCYQGEHLLEAARLAKNDLDSHEKYIKENKFSARHLRKLKNVADDLRNDVIKEAWNAYQSFRVCYTMAKSEKKIEAIIKKISKTYDQQQGVAVAVVEDELSKNSHVLGLTEQKLNKILGDMQDAISAYTQQDKAAYYQEIIANGHPGIVVLALALKHEPWSSLPAGADGKPRHLSLIDNADKDFIAKVVMPYEEQAKRALEQRGADPLQKLASSASAACTVAVGAGAVYVMSKKRQTQTPLEMREFADEARADFRVAGDDTTVLAQESVMAPITDAAATRDAELAEETVADMALETVEEAVVENLEVEAAAAGTLLGGPVGGLIALAAIEAAKEVGEAVIESAVESAGDAVSETLQEAVGAAVKSAAAATTDDATADAAGITAGEAMVDSVVEKINERVEGRLSDKLKKRLGGN